MAFSFTPSDANSISVVIGIEHLKDGYIIQSEDVTDTAETLEIADQKGRKCQIIAYDKGTTVSLTMIGPNTAPATQGSTLSWFNANGDALSCIVTSVKRTCSYNDTAKWQIEGQGYGHATYSDKTDDSL